VSEIEKLQAELDAKMSLLAEINEQAGQVQLEIDSLQRAIEAVSV